MFRNFSFRTKLISLCIMLSAVSAVVGAIGYLGLNNVNEQYTFVSSKVVPKMLLANKMFLEYRRVRITLRTLGLPGLSKDEGEKAITEANLAVEHFEQAKKEYLDLGLAPGQKELWDKVDAAWNDFKEVGLRTEKLYKSGSGDDFKKMIEIFHVECPQKAAAFTAAGDELLKFHTDLGKAKVEAADAASTRATYGALIAAIAGVSMGLIIGFIFATGMNKTIQSIVLKLNENAAQVASASAQMASSSEELSSAATEQASSLEQTASSLEEITSMIGKATESAQAAAGSAAASKKKADTGREAVDKMLGSMNEISESNQAIMSQVNASNQKMVEIVKVIQEIGNKTKVINEIVFQTKLLSFNASVEAARAGEHGKGFAVVAEEVGNLAQMSGNAAKDISEMLEGSISKVQAIVDETKTKVESLVALGKTKVETGSSVAQQCSDILNDILQEVTKVSNLSQEISQASHEQSQGVGEINKAMRQLDTVTQQNSATSEEAASSAEEMSAQAEALKAVVEELVLVMNGSGSAGASSPHARNVIQLPVKTAKPAQAFKAVSGMTVPSRDDDGFTEI